MKFPRATHPNVDYYQVVGRINRTVQVRKIGYEIVQSTGSMSHRRRAKPDEFIGSEILTKRLAFYDGHPTISVHDHRASLVEIIRFANAQPMVTQTDHASWDH